MNVLIISGGSGNDALVRGLKSIYPQCNVKVLVNAYDAGKSTGICRKVTNTLGVSDIRKNHIRMYKAQNPSPNQCFVEFYESRYDFQNETVLEEVLSKLKIWNLQDLACYAINFFKRPRALAYTYKDFNVSNIIYAEMYAELGYEETNKYFCDLLGIEDFVILNSFDNVYINALTQSGSIIFDEGNIVEYCNDRDIIVDVVYDSYEIQEGTLNPKAIEAVRSADLIVISTGTFWSSIYPTLDYCEFYKYINESSARKIWAINCDHDKDSWGVGSNQFIEFLDKLGLDLSNFMILENLDAAEDLRQPNNKYNVFYSSMENNNGKHNGRKYAKEILKLYYGISNTAEYDRIVFDFDDTLWSRDSDDDSILYSIKNVKLVNKLGKRGCIVSGNSYSSIVKKLATVYGSSLNNFGIDIWADSNSILFVSGKIAFVIPELIIDSDIDDLFEFLNKQYGLSCITDNDDYVTCLKIKPLTSLDQILVSDYLNDFLLHKFGLDSCVAYPRGRTTVDIVSKNNNKAVVLKYLDSDPKNILYIGDEIDSGNDREISELCGKFIHTKNIRETNALLQLLVNEDQT